MLKPTKTTRKNFARRVILFAAHVLERGGVGDGACEAFDDMLNVLADDDYFGTEGQCDPRGDLRD